MARRRPLHISSKKRRASARFASDMMIPRETTRRCYLRPSVPATQGHFTSGGIDERIVVNGARWKQLIGHGAPTPVAHLVKEAAGECKIRIRHDDSSRNYPAMLLEAVRAGNSGPLHQRRHRRE